MSQYPVAFLITSCPTAVNALNWSLMTLFTHRGAFVKPGPTLTVAVAKGPLAMQFLDPTPPPPKSASVVEVAKWPASFISSQYL